MYMCQPHSGLTCSQQVPRRYRHIASLVAATCKALLGNVLVNAANNISIDTQQTHVNEAAEEHPKSWLKKALHKRTAKIKSCKYITCFVTDSS